MCNNIMLINKLYTEATKSNIGQQLAAGIIKGTKMISIPCCNTNRNTYKGMYSGSLHAEAHAMITYYGKNLSFDSKRGWCLLSRKKYKDYEIKLDGC